MVRGEDKVLGEKDDRPARQRMYGFGACTDSARAGAARCSGSQAACRRIRPARNPEHQERSARGQFRSRVLACCVLSAEPRTEAPWRPPFARRASRGGALPARMQGAPRVHVCALARASC